MAERELRLSKRRLSGAEIDLALRAQGAEIAAEVERQSDLAGEGQLSSTGGISTRRHRARRALTRHVQRFCSPEGMDPTRPGYKFGLGRFTVPVVPALEDRVTHLATERELETIRDWVEGRSERIVRALTRRAAEQTTKESEGPVPGSLGYVDYQQASWGQEDWRRKRHRRLRQMHDDPVYDPVRRPLGFTPPLDVSLLRMHRAYCCPNSASKGKLFRKATSLADEQPGLLLPLSASEARTAAVPSTHSGGPQTHLG